MSLIDASSIPSRIGGGVLGGGSGGGGGCRGGAGAASASAASPTESTERSGGAVPAGSPRQLLPAPGFHPMPESDEPDAPDARDLRETRPKSDGERSESADVPL